MTSPTIKISNWSDQLQNSLMSGCENKTSRVHSYYSKELGDVFNKRHARIKLGPDFFFTHDSTACYAFLLESLSAAYISSFPVFTHVRKAGDKER